MDPRREVDFDRRGVDHDVLKSLAHEESANPKAVTAGFDCVLGRPRRHASHIPRQTLRKGQWTDDLLPCLALDGSRGKLKLGLTPSVLPISFPSHEGGPDVFDARIT